MKEGWLDEEYLALTESPDEADQLSLIYGIGEFLPGFKIIGLRGWDDFIVLGEQGQTLTVPAVPIHHDYLRPFVVQGSVGELIPDERLTGRIKWYVQPLIFGGDAASESNMAWVSQKEHADLVRWWNMKYLELRSASQKI